MKHVAIAMSNPNELAIGDKRHYFHVGVGLEPEQLLSANPPQTSTLLSKAGPADRVMHAIE